MLAPLFRWLSANYLGGLPADRLQVMSCLLLAYPLASLFRRLPSDSPPTQKHLFSLLATGFMFLVVQGQWVGLGHILLSSLVTYALMAYAGDRAWAPRAVFLFVMAHLSLTHIRRLNYDINNPPLDYSGAQMVLVIKLTTYAYNVFDGHRPDRADPQALSARQRLKAVAYKPTLLEFLGYVFFFGSFFAGPAFEFRDYTDFISLEAFRRTPPPSGSSAGVNTGRGVVVPDSRSAAYRKLAAGLLGMVGVVLITTRFPVPFMLEPAYARLAFPVRLVYILLTCFGTRLPYYVAWLLAEGACVRAGLGFGGYVRADSGSPGPNSTPTTTITPQYVAQWDQLTNVYPWRFETGQNLKELLDAWNVATNHWLKHYIYLRLTPVGAKPTLTTTLSTFFVSALWHGFFPGYYLAFMTISVMSNVARTLRRTIRPLAVVVAPIQTKVAIRSPPDHQGSAETPSSLPPHPSPPSQLGNGEKKPASAIPSADSTMVYHSASVCLTPAQVRRRKQMYDVACWLLTQLALNYSITPFMLLYWHDSIRAWQVNYFFGHVVLILIIAFYKLGGAGLLRPYHLVVSARKAD
ncbi:Lysophospholipid acyltransferase [Dimargaris cristalligena]|nr:Lysophospholipid acyltransferase [Dimargaris cristalligena]